MMWRTALYRTLDPKWRLHIARNHCGIFISRRHDHSWCTWSGFGRAVRIGDVLSVCGAAGTVTVTAVLEQTRVVSGGTGTQPWPYTSHLAQCVTGKSFAISRPVGPGAFTPFPSPCVLFAAGNGSVCSKQLCPAGLWSVCSIRIGVGGTRSIPARAGSGRSELRGASDAQLVRWPVQQTCYVHRQWIYASFGSWRIHRKRGSTAGATSGRRSRFLAGSRSRSPASLQTPAFSCAGSWQGSHGCQAPIWLFLNTGCFFQQTLNIRISDAQFWQVCLVW